MRRLQWLVPALALVLLAGSPGACPDLDMGPVEARIVSGPDEDRMLTISIKVGVANNTDNDKTVYVSIQALDADEFELFECGINGRVPAGEYRTITDTQEIEETIYDSISEWRVEQ